MALKKGDCTITLQSEAVPNGPFKHRPVLHVLMDDGRTTEFRGMAVAIPDAPADEAENRVLWLAINGKGEMFVDEKGEPIIREAPAMSLGRMSPAPDDLVSIKEISAWSGLSESTIEREVDRGQLAKPVRLSTRRNVYRFASVEAWLEKRRSKL